MKLEDVKRLKDELLRELNPQGSTAQALDIPSPIGTQVPRDWTSSETQRLTLADQRGRNEDGILLYSVWGKNVLLRVTYGTSRIVTLENLRPPFRGALIGNAHISAVKIDQGAPASATVAVARASSASRPVARQLVTAAGPIDELAVSVTALDAVALNVAGVAVALAAGESVQVIQPTTLTSGAIIAELEF